jgi:hypothetical protein
VVGAAEAERALARALRYLETEAAQGEPPPAEPASPEPASPEPAVAPTELPDPARQGEALLLASEEAAARGDAPGAVSAAISAAQAFRDANHPVAALDACTRGLGSGPDDVSLHLLIAELALERGAVGPAADTYRNLLRLAEIDGDPATRERVVAAARVAFPDDPRFAPA